MAVLDDYISMQQLADELGVNARTVRRWASTTSPGIPITRVGGKPLVHRDDFKAWLESRRVVRNAPAATRR